MNGLYGIIVDGKVYEALSTENYSCLDCDLIKNMGECGCLDLGFELGRNNIFRYSQELTDKLNYGA